MWWPGEGGGCRDALEGEGPQRCPQQRLGRPLEEVVKAVGGIYWRLQLPLKLALGVREIVAGHMLGTLEGRGPVQCILGGGVWHKAILLGGGGGSQSITKSRASWHLFPHLMMRTGIVSLVTVFLTDIAPSTMPCLHRHVLSPHVLFAGVVFGIR